jgi:CheY-like chemotaxis protein
LLDELEEMFSVKAAQKRVHLMVKCAADVPHYIRTDATKLRQVLMNLLNNAVKFTEEGDVVVRVSYRDGEIGRWGDREMGGQGDEELGRILPHSPSPHLPISPSPHLHFEVEDSGPGIAPDEIETLFEAFGQTQTGRQVQEGTGLGLAISRKFVQLMGGDIHVTSEIGNGTTFTFDIQVGLIDQSSIINHQSSIPRRVIALEPGQPRYRVLVADDKPDNRYLIVKLLVPLGFDVREAANGQEALEVWEAFEPHLIWMDMRMPIMDGYEATRRIREVERQKSNVESDDPEFQVSSFKFRVPIIALTASSFREDRTAILSTGCDDCISKPFQEADIFEIMHKHLGIRYVYKEEKAKGERRKAKGEEVLTLDVLKELSDEVYNGLRQAIELGDVEMAESFIDRIRQQNEPMAEALADLVKQFRFDLLQTFFEDSENAT